MKQNMHHVKKYSSFLLLLLTACTKNVSPSKEQINANRNSALIAANDSKARQQGKFLTISRKENISMPKIQLSPDSVYTSYELDAPLFTALPDGYEDHIVSDDTSLNLD